MPYIEQKYRQRLDRDVDDLAEKIVACAKEAGGDAAFAGLMNYACTRLAMSIVRRQFGRVRYWIIALISGTFQNVADEFYRRVGIPYEDKQIKVNGDVDQYETFNREIGV